MSKKRVLVLSDFHCGHVVGLTPPPWQQKITGDERWDKFAKLQNELWNFYENTINLLKPIDVLIVNGDLVDGHGERSGGTELITSDMLYQGEMATYAIKKVEAKSTVITFGTAYHTGEEEDLERTVANNVKANSIGSHEWVDVNGVIFDCKHHIGSSSTPFSRHGAVAKDRMWNILWNEHEEQPKADIIIRSHVHYFNYCGGPNWLGMTTPALQGMGSKFGSRRCSGTVDYGMVHFDIEESGCYTWKAHIAKIAGQKAQTIKL